MSTGLEIRDVQKSYGRHQVLAGVSFVVAPGETAAVLGENGAGKSTLAKILAGVHKADGGTVSIDGRLLTASSPGKALDQGISFIPQELVYVPSLTVAENICLGRWPTRGTLTSPRAIRRRAQEDCERVGMEFDLTAKMASLPVAQQQMVEIVKAFARRTRAIVLDEPTAALSAHDSDLLLRHMSRLAENGTAVLYISHRIDEVFRACDTVHVLRNGVRVHSAAVGDSTPREVIDAMLGQASEESGTIVSTAGARGAVVLDVRGMVKESSPEVRGVDLQVRAGEILGLYGVRGSGVESVAEVLGGLHSDATMRATVVGREVTRIASPRAAKRLGVAHVPAERKSQGLVLSMSVGETMTLLMVRRLSRFRFVGRRRERGLAAALAAKVLMRSRSLGQPVGDLSGGNQQKALVASRLATEPEILVLQEPTRGVDVGARLELHRLIRAQADEGTAVVLVSSDIEEVAVLSDRVLVVSGGAVVDEVHRPSPASQTRILEAAGGFV